MEIYQSLLSHYYGHQEKTEKPYSIEALKWKEA